MEKYRLIGIGLVLGTIIAAIIFFLGITYISGTINFIISITIAMLLLFGYFLIKYNAKRNIEIDKHEEKVKKLASEVKSIFPTIENEQSLKEFISSSIKSIRNIYTSTFLLSTFFSLSMVIVGLLASTIAIKQNNTMKNQNYLICQQNKYLATNNKFFNPQNDSNQDLYNYFERIRSIIKELLSTSKEWYYASPIDSDILNDKYSKFLPSPEFTQIIDLQKQIIKAEKTSGSVNVRSVPKFRSLIAQYKNLLKSFYAKINIKEKEIKKEREEKMLLYIENSEINCEEYKQ